MWTFVEQVVSGMYTTQQSGSAAQRIVPCLIRYFCIDITNDTLELSKENVSVKISPALRQHKLARTLADVNG